MFEMQEAKNMHIDSIIKERLRKSETDGKLAEVVWVVNIREAELLKIIAKPKDSPINDFTRAKLQSYFAIEDPDTNV